MPVSAASSDDAAAGFADTGRALPYRAQIERSFGRDLSEVTAYMGQQAAAANRRSGSRAFTHGDRVAFRQTPDLRLAAHEAAHVIQQRHGLTLAAGESAQRASHEQAADAAASRVVNGQSAADLLPSGPATRASHAPVQFDKTPPTQQEIDEYFIGIWDEWKAQWEALQPGADRAHARRVWLLLSFRPNFKTFDDVDTFLDTCLRLANDETAAVERLKKEPSVDEDFFIENGDAFPNWWADRVRDQLWGVADESQLEARWKEARKNALVNTAQISDEIWLRGLPVSLAHASTLTRGSIPELALDFEHARKYPNERIGQYARLLVNWERTLLHYSLVHWFHFQLGVRLDSIRKGELVIDEATWREVNSLTFFNVKLRVFESAASSPDDMRAAFRALLLQRPSAFYRTSLGGGYKYEWPQEGVDALMKEVAEVDALLAATDTPGHIFRAWEWAYERGYLGDAAKEVVEEIRKNWWKMAAKAMAIFIAQYIPGVNVLVDTALLVEFGLDAIGTFLDLVDTFKAIKNADTVEAMQRASAKLARSMTGLGLKIIMWALDLGARQLAKGIKRYQEGKKFLDEHGNSKEAREALSNAKGDAKKARETIAAKREQERIAREKAAADAKRAAEKQQREREERENQRQQDEQRRAQEEQARQAQEAAAKQQEEKAPPPPTQQPTSPPKPPKAPATPAAATRITNESLTSQFRNLKGEAKNAKWVSKPQDVSGPGVKDHFTKHGPEVGAGSPREYDLSARLTIQHGRRFRYRDRSSGEPRVGYWDPETGFFTATSQTRSVTAILTHFPETWRELRKLPGFTLD